jgi:HEAT repeat protein
MTYPVLTIPLLNQLTDRELQFNYLNHLERTPEIASLLTQIIDGDLALRIISLALAVDLNLGAELTSWIDPESQKIIVDRINELEVPIELKVNLWYKTKSKSALPYLQDIFIFKYQYRGNRNEIVESAITAIVAIDRDLGIKLLIEALYDARFYSKAVEIITDLAPVEAIEGLAGLLNSPDLRNYNIRSSTIAALAKIGNEAAIAEIRDILHRAKSQWSDPDWIWGLGIIAEPAMVEHLIYLLYEPEQYIHRSTENPASEEYYADEADRVRCKAIAALEHIGGEKVFDWLHQALYWVPNNDYPNPFRNITEALYRLDRSRTYTVLEGAIRSYDPVVRKRAVMALAMGDIPISDCNLSILLNAIDDPDLDVQLEIVREIRRIGWNCDTPDITTELREHTIFITKPIILQYINHPDVEIRDRVIWTLSQDEPDELELIVRSLGSVSPNICKSHQDIFASIVKPYHLSILLEYLKHDSIEVRSCAAGSIGRISDDSIIPVLTSLLSDPELSIREAAVKSIVQLGSATTFPILLELAIKSELLSHLIEQLRWNRHRSADELTDKLTIVNEFHKDRDFMLKFLDTAEQTLIELVRGTPNFFGQEISALGEIGTDRSILPIYELLKSDRGGSVDRDDDCIRAMLAINSDRSVPMLLELLPDPTTLGGSICRQLRYDGKLGVLPQLWSIHQQAYTHHLSATISEIQERDGLYNPNFSEDIYPLFEFHFPRLRDTLLGHHSSS